MQNDENSGGGSGGAPGRPGCLPGASGDDSWPKIGPTWPHLGPRNGPKIDEKTVPKSIENLNPFRRRFFTDLGRFLKPKWSQVGSKIEAQTDILFEGRFVHGCTFSLRKTYIGVETADSEVEENRSKTRSKIERKRGRISRSISIDFWSIFRPKKAPKTTRKSTENGVENRSKIEAEKKSSKTRLCDLLKIAPGRSRPKIFSFGELVGPRDAPRGGD